MRRLVIAAWVLASATGAFAQNAAVTITVDRATQRHAIDPRIYGVNNGGGAALADLNAPIDRFGGTFSSRYNWNVDAYNRGDDYFFESIVETDFGTPGKTADNFIGDAHARGAEPLMTVPMVGWVAKVGPAGETLCSFPTSTYPNQQFDDGNGCGNGASSAAGNPFITGNDPNVANVPADQTFQQSWIQHIISSFGAASAGGLKYYGYDNEPAIWHLSHRDVHPDGAGMDEVLAKTLAYGHMIRSLDADAVLVGPEEYNWDGYFTSGKDIQFVNDPANGCSFDPSCEPDRVAHGDVDYVPWLLDQLHQHDVNTGERLLDVFAVHFYPQGDQSGHSEFTDNVHDAVDSATQLLRNRSTRSLWDPSYVDQSYIQSVIQLIPRLKDWASTYYPGTQVGLTEYSWGADNHMNGATTQADILGIFGREGLDLAARWEIPPTESPVYKAYEMYRNYDGAKSTFGETSVQASSASGAEADTSDHVSVFAAERASDGALTVMIVSKYLSGNTNATVDVQNFSSGSSALAWRLKSNVLSQVADVPVSGGSLSLTLPHQSVTLLVLPAGGSVLSVADASAPEPASGTTTAQFTVSLDAPAVQTVTVDYATSDVTAVAGTDYTTAVGTLTFAVGESEKTVDVTILPNPATKLNTTFRMVLSNSNGATVARAIATGTIVDNSRVPKIQFSAASYSVSEASAHGLVTVRRVGPATGTLVVSYATFDGMAVAPGDYTPAVGQLTFPSGAVSRTISVPIVQDTVTEKDESVLLRLTDLVGAGFLGSPTTAVLTIKNNDLAGAFSISPASVRVAEGSSAKLTVRRTGGTNGAVTVDWATVDGSATAGSDYTGTGAPVTLAFAAGQTLQTITVPVTADGLAEGEEYFRVVLSNATGGATLAAASAATLTISSKDDAVEFTASAYSVSEAAAQASIAVKRTGSLALPMTVAYAASDGSGLVGVDYLASAGTLTFAKGMATRTFPVKLVHDTVARGPRTVNLTLSAQSAGALGTSQAVLTIKDHDLAGTVQFAVSDVTVSEGGGTALVKVSRTGKLVAGQGVDLVTSDGSAAAGINYVDASQTLVFADKEASKTIAVTILDDGVPGDGARSVALTLANPTGGAAVGARGTATLWIVENR